jgi:hypothetical protein
LLDATPQVRISGVKTSGLAMDQLATSGLGGVWAEENTREAIFAAMQRKETFGTSGVRIKVRFFGGWDFAPEDHLDGKTPRDSEFVSVNVLKRVPCPRP